jgi:diguanylate cyclase (GGDEF)-like protein
VRQGDIAGRFGGEEFVLILAQCNELNAKMAAERVRQRVEAMIVEDGDQKLKVTISLGVRHIKAEDKDITIEEVFSQADKALYYSKNNGRNKATLYVPKKKTAAEPQLVPNTPETGTEPETEEAELL